MNRTIRVTIVVMDVGPIGGMERQLSEVIKGLLQAGHQVTVIARTCLVPDAPPGLRFIRVPVFQRPMALAYPLFVILGTLRVLRHRGDLVHVNGGLVLNRADVYTVHFCHKAFQRMFGLKERTRRGLAYRVNGWVSDAYKRCFERLSLRAPRVRRVVAISSGVGLEIQREYPEVSDRVRVIPYGLDRSRFRVSPHLRRIRREELELTTEQLAAVFVGGDWARKGLDIAIGALKDAPAWQLLIVGEGDQAAFADHAARIGVRDRVRFLGRETRPERTYNAADAFVFPTAYETFSLVAHEAAGCGLPLIVPRAHGIEDLVIEPENGWFVARDATAIAERLRELEQPELRERMGHRAAEAAQRYDWSNAVHEHLALYAELTT